MSTMILGHILRRAPASFIKPQVSDLKNIAQTLKEILTFLMNTSCF